MAIERLENTFEKDEQIQSVQHLLLGVEWIQNEENVRMLETLRVARTKNQLSSGLSHRIYIDISHLPQRRFTAVRDRKVSIDLVMSQTLRLVQVGHAL